MPNVSSRLAQPPTRGRTGAIETSQPRKIKIVSTAKDVYLACALPDRIVMLNTISPDLVAVKGGKYKSSDSRILNLSGREVPVVYRYVENEAVKAYAFSRCGFLD